MFTHPLGGTVWKRHNKGDFMEQAWRVPFARFLREHGAAEAGKARHHVHWVGRWLASGGSDAETLTPAAISRFVDELGRTEEPGTVRQAEEAIRLYGFFRARRRSAWESAKDGSSEEWDALVLEMTRIALLKHLSLRTERSYLGWVERFRAFTGAPPPATLAPPHVARRTSRSAPSCSCTGTSWIRTLGT